MLEHADIWSVDKYLSLHYGWPFNVCDKGDIYKSYMHYGVRKIWDEMHLIYDAFAKFSGQNKPLEICEFNADGDVGGRRDQAALLTGFYRRVIKEKPKFLKAITYYQFRDRGRRARARRSEQLERRNPIELSRGLPADPGERAALFAERDMDQAQAREPRVMSYRASDDAEGLGWR